MREEKWGRGPHGLPIFGEVDSGVVRREDVGRCSDHGARHAEGCEMLKKITRSEE